MLHSIILNKQEREENMRNYLLELMCYNKSYSYNIRLLESLTIWFTWYEALCETACKICQTLTEDIEQDMIEGVISNVTIGGIKDHIIALHQELQSKVPTLQI
jgi:hypothetical protein